MLSLICLSSKPLHLCSSSTPFFSLVTEEEVVDRQVHKPKAHHKETHGTSNDIDENTPVDEVKAPSVFERAKEEIEAIVEAIHHKKESGK